MNRYEHEEALRGLVVDLERVVDNLEDAERELHGGAEEGLSWLRRAQEVLGDTLRVEPHGNSGLADSINWLLGEADLLDSIADKARAGAQGRFSPISEGESVARHREAWREVEELILSDRRVL